MERTKQGQQSNLIRHPPNGVDVGKKTAEIKGNLKNVRNFFDTTSGVGEYRGANGLKSNLKRVQHFFYAANAGSIRRSALEVGFIFLCMTVIVLLALTLNKMEPLGDGSVIVEVLSKNVLLKEKSGKNFIQAESTSTKKGKVIRIKRTFKKAQHRSIVTCDPDSYKIVDSRDIFISGFSVLRINTKYTPEGFLIETKKGGHNTKVILPDRSKNSIYHAEVLPFLTGCIRCKSTPQDIIVFDPRVARVFATSVVPKNNECWEYTNDIRSVSVTHDFNYRLISVKETIGEVEKEFSKSEKYSKKVTN